MIFGTTTTTKRRNKQCFTLLTPIWNCTEYLTQCVVCKTRKWVRTSNLLNHTGISCRCVPKQLIGRKIGKYFVVDNRERKNDASLPEIFCEKENGNNVWVSKERLLRTLADELVKEKKSTAHK